jgi:MFS family permease
MDFYRQLFTNDGPGKAISFTLVYVISVIFTFQSLVTAYSGSTYLEQFVRPEFIGLVYSVASFLAIILTLLLPRILRAIGNVATTISMMLVLMFMLTVVGLAPSPTITILAFIIFTAVFPQIYFNIDIFLETLIGEEEGLTGSKRGLILTLMSLAAFCSPIAMGLIIGDSDDLSGVYFVSAAIGFLFLAVLIAKFRHFYDPVYETVRVRDLVRAAFVNKDVSTVMYTQFLLQVFYTWAIIYIPLFLATVVGFNWEAISKIIAVGLLAFVIFEYPIGIIADKYIGEKEMMATGFVILAIASASIYAMSSAGIVVWMAVMFFSRLGASLVEVTTESYFFKQVKGHDSNLISFFRLTRPLGILVGTLMASVTLFFLPFNLAFVVLALVMVTGAFATLRITDSR